MRGFTELRKRLEELLKKEFPENSFKVRNFSFVPRGVSVDVQIGFDEDLNSEALLKVASEKDLDLNRCVGPDAVHLYDYNPRQSKPYTVRNSGGKVFTAGAVWTEKVFKRGAQSMRFK